MPVIPKGYIITDKCCDKTRFYDTLADFPETGLVSRLYVDRETGIIYVWDGSEYISADTADRFHFFNTSVSTYNPALPLTGWTQPTPLEGATATIQFAGGTEVNYTSDGITWNVNFANIKPKVHKSLLSQIDADLPTFTVLENMLGGTVVWTRNDIGDYTGILAGAFAGTFIKKTSVFIDGGDSIKYYLLQKIDDNEISLTIYTGKEATIDVPIDAATDNLLITIEIYP